MQDAAADGVTMHAASAADGVPESHWYRRLGSPPFIVAPMVDQSELAFRALCRRHGCGLCYTPMFSARQFASSEKYRSAIFPPADGLPESDDRPLVVQFAGHEPDSLLESAKRVQHRCDAVDINMGCPQKIARRGRYGAWLLHEPELLQQLVGTLHCHLDVPVTCKIRLAQEDGFRSSRASVSATVDLARMLVGAGASVVAVHGRTREQKGEKQGGADWAAIAAVKSALSVPVFANGGVSSRADARECLRATRADGVMSAEGLLSNPALFEEGSEGGALNEALAIEYLELQARYPTDLRSVKQHLFSLLFAGLQVNVDLRAALGAARTLDDMRAVVDELAARPKAVSACGTFCSVLGVGEYTPWYSRHAREVERAARKAQRMAEEAAVADVGAGGEEAAPPGAAGAAG